MQFIDPGMACIPSNYSRLIARELCLQARDIPDLLVRTHLSVEQFLQEDTLLSPRQQLEILKNALRLANDDTFGLRVGQRLTSPTHGAMGFLVNSSPDLLTALKAFQAFIPTRMNLGRLELVTRDDWLEVELSFGVPLTGELERVLSEIAVVMFFDSAEFIVGRPVDEVISCFTHPAPSCRERYADHIPGLIEFDAPTTLVKIPLELCKVPNASANHENYMMALQQCQAMLAQLQEDKTSCTYQVQKMMLSQPPGLVGEEEAAAALFMSKRTLARRLKQEGTSFRQIRDDILSQQAVGYLRDSTMSVDAIAELMNYHDSANFRRAFKRWFNLTPDQYRREAAATPHSPPQTEYAP